jgi:hypothetical protein
MSAGTSREVKFFGGVFVVAFCLVITQTEAYSVQSSHSAPAAETGNVMHMDEKGGVSLHPVGGILNDTAEQTTNGWRFHLSNGQNFWVSVFPTKPFDWERPEHGCFGSMVAKGIKEPIRPMRTSTALIRRHLGDTGMPKAFFVGCTPEGPALYDPSVF